MGLRKADSLALIGAVTGLVVLVGVFAETARDSLAFSRQGIEAGEIWRLLSGHFVHLGWSHLALNLVGLLLVWYLVAETYTVRAWLVILAVVVAGIDLGLWLFEPQLEWYVGLSGVLHGFFAAGAVRWLWRREAEGLILALFLVGKLVWEQVYGALPMSVSSSGGPVVVDAHLYGAVTGTVVAVLFLRDWTGAHR